MDDVLEDDVEEEGEVVQEGESGSNNLNQTQKKIKKLTTQH